MTIVEKLTKEIYEECKRDGEPVTWAEALDMATAEVNAKVISASERVQSEDKTQKKERKPRKPNTSDAKKQIFQQVLEFLSDNFNTNVLIDNKKIQILYENKSFILDLVENRPKKTENGAK